MRRPLLALAPIALAALLLGACGGDDKPEEQPPPAGAGVLPTATPFARLPSPIIVSGTAAAGTGASTGSANESRYRVEAGDSLLAIANRFDTTVEAIVRRNNLADASQIRAGQELIIPGGTRVAAATPAATAVTPAVVTPASTPVTPVATAVPTRAATPVATTTASASRKYTVKSGDTASEIAEQFGVTMAALAAANGMTVAQLGELRAGQEITIPGR